VTGETSDLGWWRLRQDGDGAAELGFRSFPLEVETPAGAVRLALGEDGEARILIPLAPGEPFPVLTDGRGIVLRDTVLSAAGSPVRFIDLTCREAQLEDVFSGVVHEILVRLASGGSAGATVESAVRDFRRLLLRGTGTEVTLERALGLVGELTVLERLLTRSPRAWRAWTGPPDGRHDFRVGALALEVKSTLRVAARRVTISAADQLIEPEGGALTLVWRSFEQVVGGAESVPRLASRVLAQVDDVEGAALRLEAAGFEADFADAWAAFEFSQLSGESYRVSEGFPRLSWPQPAGVHKVRYEVDLSAADPFRLDRASEGAAFDALVATLS
jgi:hypothetical protein